MFGLSFVGVFLSMSLTGFLVVWATLFFEFDQVTKILK